MNTIEIIRKKRFGGELTEQEIDFFVKGISNGDIADYQASAMLMAMCINGLTSRETLALTMSMAHSGDILDLSDVPGIKADKHSTGGVGDTTSLVLVPLVASCGVNMAKMSGRGLGFTGGTLDKLESFPGLSVSVDIERFKQQVREIGCAIVGQTKDLAPADKVLYALRDVTGTVDYVPLGVSSIISKKMAASCDVVVLDVKAGNGALAGSMEESIDFATTMVRIGNMSGRKYSALITDMSQPLGNKIGNALEVEEAIEILSGEVADGDLKTVALALGAQILLKAGKVTSREEGVKLLQQKIDSGEGLKRFEQMITAQGGDFNALPKAKTLIDVCSDKSGYLSEVDVPAIGNTSKLIGAGRTRKEDAIDSAVGIVMKKRIGDEVKRGDVLCTLHMNDTTNKITAYNTLKNAMKLSDAPVKKPTLIYEVIE